MQIPYQREFPDCLYCPECQNPFLSDRNKHIRAKQTPLSLPAQLFASIGRLLFIPPNWNQITEPITDFISENVNSFRFISEDYVLFYTQSNWTCLHEYSFFKSVICINYFTCSVALMALYCHIEITITSLK